MRLAVFFFFLRRAGPAPSCVFITASRKASRKGTRTAREASRGVRRNLGAGKARRRRRRRRHRRRGRGPPAGLALLRPRRGPPRRPAGPKGQIRARGGRGGDAEMDRARRGLPKSRRQGREPLLLQAARWHCSAVPAAGEPPGRTARARTGKSSSASEREDAGVLLSVAQVSFNFECSSGLEQKSSVVRRSKIVRQRPVRILHLPGEIGDVQRRLLGKARGDLLPQKFCGGSSA